MRSVCLRMRRVMAKVIKIILFVCVHYVQCVPPSPTSAVTDMLQAEFSTLKNTIKVLSDQWEKWNTLFVTSLEPRITSTASTLASIDSNIHNLQERAHVWDTFQLHVSAWNDQLASLDRKIDIISKGQEKVLSLDNKINAVLGMEYQLDNTIKKLNNLHESITTLDTTVHAKKVHDALFSEFATRGVLSSIKMVEKKLDRLLIVNQNSMIKTKASDEKPKFTIRCNTPRIIEDLLNDISSKVDVIFDSISNGTDEEDDSDYDNDYVEVRDGSGDIGELKLQPKIKRLKKATRKITVSCRQKYQVLEDILNRTTRIENNFLSMLEKENMNFDRLSAAFTRNWEKILMEQLTNYSAYLIKNSHLILGSHFGEQRAHFESTINQLNKKCTTSVDDTHNRPPEMTDSVFTNEITTIVSTPTDSGTSSGGKTSLSQDHDDNPQPTWKPVVNKSSCEDLDRDDVSGVYIFEKNVKGRDTELFYNKRYCEIRSDGLWTVIQRRDNYTLQHNFNASWEDYKYGFGDLHRDFWMGNDFLYKISNTQNLILRIELEDFENNSVWAEYDTFVVSSENDNYKLTTGGYTGNASDSFSGHNGTYFSTYDKTNDLAPECCPCSVSYGGGWWFHRCFESNLNGIYFKRSHENNYFRGIIWEHWLGNYSLKKSVMMIKSKRRTYYDPMSSEIPNTETIPYYEDP